MFHSAPRLAPGQTPLKILNKYSEIAPAIVTGTVIDRVTKPEQPAQKSSRQSRKTQKSAKIAPLSPPPRRPRRHPVISAYRDRAESQIGRIVTAEINTGGGLSLADEFRDSIRPFGETSKGAAGGEPPSPSRAPAQLGKVLRAMGAGGAGAHGLQRRLGPSTSVQRDRRDQRLNRFRLRLTGLGSTFAASASGEPTHARLAPVTADPMDIAPALAGSHHPGRD